MPAHPLVATVKAGITLEADQARAQQEADTIEALVAEACTLTEATAFTALVQQIERLVQPWRVNFPTQGLVAWHEGVRGALHRHALAVFGPAGGLLAPAPTAPLSGPPAPLRGGPRSRFGL